MFKTKYVQKLCTKKRNKTVWYELVGWVDGLCVGSDEGFLVGCVVGSFVGIDDGIPFVCKKCSTLVI